jgi:hypothetical protein
MNRTSTLMPPLPRSPIRPGAPSSRALPPEGLRAEPPAIRYEPAGHLKAPQGARTRRLISRGRDAQRRPRRLVAKPLSDASGWLEGFRPYWEGNFQRLDSLLDEMKLDRKISSARKTKGKLP